jgi:hypothetical protein
MWTEFGAQNATSLLIHEEKNTPPSQPSGSESAGFPWA